MNFFDNNNMNKKKVLINYNMVEKCDVKCSLKKICVDRVRLYNNNYKDNIVRTYRNYLDIDDDDRELLKENLGIDFVKKRKRIRMESGSEVKIIIHLLYKFESYSKLFYNLLE